MQKTVLAIAAAATIAAGTLTAPAPAEARCNGCGVAAGVIGGLAAGAIIAGAARPYSYGPAYAYGPGPGPYPCVRRRAVYDAYGNFAGYRPVRVC